MVYICVRTYDNGKYVNKVYNIFFEWLSQAERMVDILNKTEREDTEKWICMPMNKYAGDEWK